MKPDAIRRGTISLLEGGERTLFGAGDPHAEVRVRDPRLWLDVLLGGSVGLGEAFVAGRFTTDDPTALVRVFLANAPALPAVEGRLAGALRWIDAIRRADHAATPEESREHVAAHYDIGNDFYELVLDPTLSYSCAKFSRPGMTLEEASIEKIRGVCEALALSQGTRLLEIGTGWGALATYAGAVHGSSVVTTTISRAQHELASRRVASAGLADRVRVLDHDWRELTGSYDAIACVEMIEAIGHRHHDAFLARCRDLLLPGGRMLLQTIVIGDDRFEWSKDRRDFVKKHVFPGSCIPSQAVLRRAALRAGLRWERVDDLTEHYAPTLRAWRQNLLASAAAIRARGYPATLIRTWEWYLSLCEASFHERWLGDVQILLERPR